MSTQIRLNSVLPHGVSGPEAGAMDLIYEFLLKKYKQNAYSYISVNQIGDDLNEVIIKDGKNIYTNVRYPAPVDFELKNDDEKNKIRLEVIHIGLTRIAAKEKKLDIHVLEDIKNTILENNFSFDLVLKTFINKKNRNILARLIVQPKARSFHYYMQIEEDEKVKCKLPIYNGFTNTFYVRKLFGVGKWKKNNDFILTGKNGEVEIHIIVDSCEIKYINLTKYEKAPSFEMFRSDISPEEREKARQDWHHSLPPAIASFLRDANN